MADLFRCDHCGAVLAKDKKKGTLTLQVHTWNGGVFFGSQDVHKHDLCLECYSKLFDAIRKLLPALNRGITWQQSKAR